MFAFRPIWAAAINRAFTHDEISKYLVAARKWMEEKKNPENKSFYDKYSFSKLAGPRFTRTTRIDNIIKYYISLSFAYSNQNERVSGDIHRTDLTHTLTLRQFYYLLWIASAPARRLDASHTETGNDCDDDDDDDEGEEKKYKLNAMYILVILCASHCHPLQSTLFRSTFFFSRHQKGNYEQCSEYIISALASSRVNASSCSSFLFSFSFAFFVRHSSPVRLFLVGLFRLEK